MACFKRCIIPEIIDEQFIEGEVSKALKSQLNSKDFYQIILKKKTNLKF